MMKTALQTRIEAESIRNTAQGSLFYLQYSFELYFYYVHDSFALRVKQGVLTSQTGGHPFFLKTVLNKAFKAHK